MSYVRFGPESDVYVIDHVGGYWHCYCKESFSPEVRGTGFSTTYLPQMVEHLEEHKAKGDKVPQYAINALKEELEEFGPEYIDCEEEV